MFIGTDPEFFILDKEGNPVPAHRFFPGKDAKKETEKDYMNPKRFNGTSFPVKYFRDGYALELNPPGTHCRQLMFSDVANGLLAALEALPPGYTLSSVPAVKVNLDELMDAPPDVLQFGCDPSWDAYTGKQKFVELDARTFPLRVAGGHMHFSTFPVFEHPDYGKVTPYAEDFPLLNEANYALLTKMFDKWIGVPLTYILEREETFVRRRYYGQAGEYRIQKYPPPPQYRNYPNWVGIEYRTPGSDLYNHKVLASLFFHVGREIIRAFPTRKKTWDNSQEPAVQRAINTGEGLTEQLSSFDTLYTPEVIIKTRELLGKDRFKFNWLVDGPEGRAYPRVGAEAAVAGYLEGWTEFKLRNFTFPGTKKRVA